MSETIAKEQIDQLVEDASYMQDEAEALKYVIDQVPHQEKPPHADGRSISDLLIFIDDVQKYYYRSYLEEAIENPRPIQIERFNQFSEEYEPSDRDSEDIQSLLDDVAKHRAGLLNTIKSVPAIDWGSDVYVNDQKISLFKFIKKIIHFDHVQLKKIAELVRAFTDQKHTERQIEQKRDMRNPSIDESNNVESN